MVPGRLKEIMLDQKSVFEGKKQLIRRDIELDRYIRTGQVVIVTGIRRCGKSTLLFLIKEQMSLTQEQYCYFNFDDERIEPVVGILEEIYRIHLELYGRDPVFFLDEIQHIAGWEKFVNRMFEQGLKIFVTGSNARMLSSEISTSLTGRNLLLELQPFSFSEYLRYLGHSYDTDRLTTKTGSLLLRDLGEYMESGGFPTVVREHDPGLVHSYFQDILYRDIIARYRLAQVNEIRQIGIWFASNAGKIFSYSTLQEISGVKSLSSIKDYLGYYEQSYLFYYLKKFDWSVKKQVMNPKKVFAADPAFIHRLGFGFSENKGRVLENIVFLELIRREEEVYYHAGKSECDFIVKKGPAVTTAIQVAWELSAGNMDREIKGLREAMTRYSIPEGYLLYFTSDPAVSTELPGIKAVQAAVWLMGKKSQVAGGNL